MTAIRLLPLLLLCPAASGQETKRPPFTAGRQDIQFKESSPLTAAKDLPGRFGAAGKPPDYDIAKEKFEIIIPKEYSHDTAWGVIVWMPAGNKPNLPAGFEAVLADRKLISIAPYEGGAGRNKPDQFPFDRFRLAADAAHNVRQAFNIDPKRVYVGGLGPAGAKVASIAGVAYSDVFTGTYCPGGIHFHVKVPGDAGKYYPPVFTPTAKALAAAKKDGRFALLGNETDPSALCVKRTFEKGFKPAGFKNVLYLDAPDKQAGSAEMLAQSLDYLDGKK